MGDESPFHKFFVRKLSQEKGLYIPGIKKINPLLSFEPRPRFPRGVIYFRPALTPQTYPPVPASLFHLARDEAFTSQIFSEVAKLYIPGTIVDQVVWIGGTAFPLCNEYDTDGRLVGSVWATAGHSIRRDPPFIPELSGLCMSLNTTAPRFGVQVPLDQIFDVVPVRVLYGCDAVRTEFKEQLDIDPLTGVPWREPLDFALLFADGLEAQNMFIPNAALIDKNREIVVVGFPNETITVDGAEPENDRDRAAKEAISTTERRYASPGHISPQPGTLATDDPRWRAFEPTSRLLPHNASTAHGFSGAVVAPLAAPDTFVGTGVGSAPNPQSGQDVPIEDLQHNVALSVRHPGFVAAYKRFVLPHIQRHRLSAAQNAALDAYVAEFGA